MGKKHHSNSARDKPTTAAKQRSVLWLGDWNDEGDLTCRGYTSLAHNPEICAGVQRIASLVGSMTIYLMENGELGNTRVNNDLARLVDITPNRYMNRSNFIQWIVNTLYLSGNGNAVCYPVTENGYLRELVPIAPARVSLRPHGPWEYMVGIDGHLYDPADVLHFTVRPDEYYPWMGTGYRVVLADVAQSLKQAAATSKAFMSSKWKPSVVVKVDGISEKFQSKAGRQEILNDYLDTAEAGQPWVIPAEQMAVQSIRPLTLSDLALADTVKLDKQTVAAILGIPAFVLGVGDFSRDAWNNFISTTIMPLAEIIEQELTRKLLYSPTLFYRFNSRSLYNYSLTDMVTAGGQMMDRLAMDRNEFRSWVNLEPREDMVEMLALENYIPVSRLGDQKKLNGGDNA